MMRSFEGFAVEGESSLWLMTGACQVMPSQWRSSIMRIDEFGAGAVGVEVFVAEEEGAVGSAGSLEGLPEGGGVAEMEEAGG